MILSDGIFATAPSRTNRVLAESVHERHFVVSLLPSDGMKHGSTKALFAAPTDHRAT